MDKMDEHKRQALANGRKRQIEPGEVRHEPNDRKRLKCDCLDEKCLQIKSGKVGTDLKLECECICNSECMSECSDECRSKCNTECIGNKQWIGGRNESTLIHNKHIVDKSRNLQIPEQPENMNSIIIKNPTEADLKSVFTCSSGTLSKSINLNEHESCLQIELYKVGTDLILECTCTCNMECMGNTQWTGGQNGTTLIHNKHIVDINKAIEILEQTAYMNNFILKNPTEADLKSNATCSFGKLSKSVSLNTYIEKSPQTSPTVSSDTATGESNAPTVTATGGSNDTTIIPADGPNVTTGTITGAPNGFFITTAVEPSFTTVGLIDLDVEMGSLLTWYYLKILLVICIAIFFIILIYLYVKKKLKKEKKEEEEEEEEAEEEEEEEEELLGV